MTFRLRTFATLVVGLIGLPMLPGVPSAEAGEMVTFQNAMGQETRGYLAKPEDAEGAPAILVIQEWWGLTDWIKQNADRFAEHGYIALAVDLYDGKATDDPAEAHELMRALDPTEGVADLKGGLDYLASLPGAGSEKVGAIGWCMGGMYARLIAQDSDRVGPTAICYGSVTTDAEQVKALGGRPVLGLFGAQDRGIPAEKVLEVFKALEEGGSPVTLKIFEDAGHAFMRPGGDQYVEPAANEAWTLIDAFFEETLKP